MENDNIIHIYTDGGCRMKKIGEFANIGAWAYTLEYNGHYKEGSEAVVNTTNNQMELTAIIKALESLKRFDLQVVIYSDSAYCVNGITNWIKGWKAKGWITSKKEPVENKNLWVLLDNIQSKFENIRFVKVKGHSDIDGNVKVDTLLNNEMDKACMEINDEAWLKNKGFEN